MGCSFKSKKILSIILVFIFAVFLGVSYPAQEEKATHLDTDKNPGDCSSCHGGRGVPGTPLLKSTKEGLCYNCHGISSRGGSKRDIESVFAKISKHPVMETTKYHFQGEDLPERFPSASRHVACADCHEAHRSTSDKPWKGVKGYLTGKVRGRMATKEYELCYQCHSDSANLPASAKNKANEFDPFNQSYHPVEMVGRNKTMPSLIRGLNVNTIIKCTDCHGNNDPRGAKGPHGSDYSPILVAEYRTFEGPESPRAYELCYMCHDRRSILSDESFYRHNLHISTVQTSCHTCHNSHGVSNSRNLISFNPSIVSLSATGVLITYIPDANPSRCYLRCHDVDHQVNGVFRASGPEILPGW